MLQKGALLSPSLSPSPSVVCKANEDSGDDDFFSTDLDATATASIWTRFTKPVLVLHSAEDQYVPAHVDKAALIAGWRELNPAISGLSGVIPHASHDVTQPQAQVWLADTVAEFLKTV